MVKVNFNSRGLSSPKYINHAVLLLIGGCLPCAFAEPGNRPFVLDGPFTLQYSGQIIDPRTSADLESDLAADRNTLIANSDNFKNYSMSNVDLSATQRRSSWSKRSLGARATFIISSDGQSLSYRENLVWSDGDQSNISVLHTHGKWYGFVQSGKVQGLFVESVPGAATAGLLSDFPIIAYRIPGIEIIRNQRSIGRDTFAADAILFGAEGSDSDPFLYRPTSCSKGLDSPVKAAIEITVGSPSNVLTRWQVSEPQTLRAGSAFKRIRYSHYGAVGAGETRYLDDVHDLSLTSFSDAPESESAYIPEENVQPGALVEYRTDEKCASFAFKSGSGTIDEQAGLQNKNHDALVTRTKRFTRPSGFYAGITVLLGLVLAIVATPTQFSRKHANA